MALIFHRHSESLVNLERFIRMFNRSVSECYDCCLLIERSTKMWPSSRLLMQGSKEMLLKQETNAKVSQYQFCNTVMSN